MATFDCTYLDESGINQSVSRFGPNESSVASALRDEGVDPLTIILRTVPGSVEYEELALGSLVLKSLACLFAVAAVLGLLTIGMDLARSVYIMAVCLPCSVLCFIARYAVLALRDIAINTRGK
jgi:hypothetical protein